MANNCVYGVYFPSTKQKEENKTFLFGYYYSASFVYTLNAIRFRSSSAIKLSNSLTLIFISSESIVLI